MSEKGKFLIYCMEQYKTAKKITGKEVAELFHEYDVSNYILSYYEALHTTGERYIIQDIDLYIDARRST